MKKLFILLLIISATGSFETFAQPVIYPEPKPTIEVRGTAEMEVIPDEIFIKIIIKERYSGKDKISIEAQEDSLKRGLKLLGIEIDKLSLANADADYVWARWWKKDVITQKVFTLKANSAAKLGEVFKLLDRLQIQDASISKVNHSKMDSLRKEVRIKSIKAAKEKADYLLAAIGEQAGKPILVREEEINIWDNPMVNYKTTLRNESKDEVALQTDEEVQFQKIKITASVFVQFLIK